MMFLQNAWAAGLLGCICTTSTPTHSSSSALAPKVTKGPARSNTSFFFLHEKYKIQTKNQKDSEKVAINPTPHTSLMREGGLSFSNSCFLPEKSILNATHSIRTAGRSTSKNSLCVSNPSYDVSPSLPERNPRKHYNAKTSDTSNVFHSIKPKSVPVDVHKQPAS